jgi:hypothetical protein
MTFIVRCILPENVIHGHYLPLVYVTCYACFLYNKKFLTYRVQFVAQYNLGLRWTDRSQNLIHLSVLIAYRRYYSLFTFMEMKIHGRRRLSKYVLILCMSDDRTKDHKTVTPPVVQRRQLRSTQVTTQRRLLSLRTYRKFVFLNPVACKVTRAESMTVVARRWNWTDCDCLTPVPNHTSSLSSHKRLDKSVLHRGCIQGVTFVVIIISFRLPLNPLKLSGHYMYHHV